MGPMKIGLITSFDVVAKCPYCDEETSVFINEMRNELCQCQHCEEDFQVKINHNDL